MVVINWVFCGTDVITGVIFPTSGDTACINHAAKDHYQSMFACVCRVCGRPVRAHEDHI